MIRYYFDINKYFHFSFRGLVPEKMQYVKKNFLIYFYDNYSY